MIVIVAAFAVSIGVALDRPRDSPRVRAPPHRQKMTGLDRELDASRQEAIEADQDAIEHALGFDRPVDADSRRWSGLA